MPNSRSLRRARLLWLLRAAAILCCALWISAAVRSTSFAEGRWSSHQLGINAAIAVCTWHSVSSGFFPPAFLTDARQEQIADRAQDQVAFESHIATAFVVIHSDLSLVVLEATLHPPTREGRQQHRPDRSLRGRIADEELDLLRVQYVAGHDQVHRLPWQAVVVLGMETGVLDLPDHRPLVAVLDAPALPGLVPELRPGEQLLDPNGRTAPRGQPRDLAAPSLPPAMVGPRDHARRLEPAREAAGHFPHEALPPRRQATQEVGLASVALVERG